jgi:putative transcription factor
MWRGYSTVSRQQCSLYSSIHHYLDDVFISDAVSCYDFLFSFLSSAVWFYLLFDFPRDVRIIYFSYGAGGNASAHTSTVMSARKLEEATDVGTIAKVDRSLSKAIMQARMAKKMSQKELATLINEKPQVVAEYESGKAIPNPQIIGKIERKLGCKLPRPGKSKAPPKAGAAGAKTAKAGATRGGPPKRR